MARCADLLMALALLVLSWISQEFVMLFCSLLLDLLLRLLLLWLIDLKVTFYAVQQLRISRISRVARATFAICCSTAAQ